MVSVDLRIIIPIIIGTTLTVLSSGQSIERIGNKLIASQSGVDNVGSTILLNDKALSSGTLFAFSAFFRSLKPAVFQIWRPNGTLNEYALVAQTRYLPTVENQREDVYLSTLFAGCILIQNDDKLGCYTEEIPAPVAYMFDPQTPTSLMRTKTNPSVPYKIGEKVLFDPLTFPYSLSVAAYIDTRIDPDNVTIINGKAQCPNLIIPDDTDPTLPTTTPTPPPTGKPGDTGARGPQGFQGPAGGTGPKGDPGTNGTTGPTGAMGLPGKDGMDGEDGMNGTMGATGMQGPSGGQGGTGSTGPAGPAGEDGTPGKNGNNGKDGENGKDGNDGKDAVYDPNAAASTDEENIWLNPILILILVIWLIIVTIILLILTCIFCCYACRNKKKEEEKPEYARAASQASANNAYVNVGYTGETDADKKHVNRMSSFEPGQEWIGNMKADDTVQYANSTIDRESKRRSKPPPLNGIEPHIYDETNERKIPKTPDSTLDFDSNGTAQDNVTVEVPPTPDTPSFPPPPPEAAVSSDPSGGAEQPVSPTTPPNRWSQSNDQTIAY